MRDASGATLIAAGENRGPLKIFKLKKASKIIALQPDDISAFFMYANGTKQKRDLPYGSSFLSKSGRFLNIDANVASIEIINYSGKGRRLKS